MAEGLPAEGEVRDDERIGALAVDPGGDVALDEPGDPMTVRPNELVRDVRAELRRRGDDAPDRVYVTTARGRLLGTVEQAVVLGPSGATA